MRWSSNAVALRWTKDDPLLNRTTLRNFLAFMHSHNIFNYGGAQVSVPTKKVQNPMLQSKLIL